MLYIPMSGLLSTLYSLPVVPGSSTLSLYQVTSSRSILARLTRQASVKSSPSDIASLDVRLAVTLNSPAKIEVPLSND